MRGALLREGDVSLWFGEEAVFRAEQRDSSHISYSNERQSCSTSVLMESQNCKKIFFSSIVLVSQVATLALSQFLLSFSLSLWRVVCYKHMTFCAPRCFLFFV